MNPGARPAAQAKNLGRRKSRQFKTTQKAGNTALKSAAAKDKAVRDKKKRAVAARAALDLKKTEKGPPVCSDKAGNSERTMSQGQDNLIVVLDIGSAWTRVLAADLNEGALRYRGHGVVESAGMRKGLIADLGPAFKVVKAASEQAERVARANIDECVVGVGGPHIRGINTNGGIVLGNRMREIAKEDVRYAVERARAIERPPDREILHLLPRQFVLDDQPGIFDPTGMVGSRLEVDLHIATCSGSALQSSVTCANRAGLAVTEAVLESDCRRRIHPHGRRAGTGSLPHQLRRPFQRPGRVLRGSGGPHGVCSDWRSALHQRSCCRAADGGGRG